MKEDLIVAFQQEYVVTIKASSFQTILKFRINDSLSLENCSMDSNGFSKCNDFTDKSILLCALCVHPNEIDKICYKSMF